jgi:phosphatidate cytidylyltransferase
MASTSTPRQAGSPRGPRRAQAERGSAQAREERGGGRPRERRDGGETREPRGIGRLREGRGGGQRREPRRHSELVARILVAIPAAVLAIGIIDIGGLAWALFATAIGIACMHELYRLLARWRPVPAVAFASMVAMGLAALYYSPRTVLLAAVATVPVLFIAILARRQSRGATFSIAATLLGVFWIGFGLAHAVLLRQALHGGGILIDVLLATFLGDTAAYLGGRLFGRTPLAPSISPKKTVEGLVCGALIAIVTLFCATLFQPWLTRGDALALGLAVAALAPLGDLFESLIKRDAGAKDTGHLLGAHGGALDRIDAALFTVVAAYYIWGALPHT